MLINIKLISFSLLLYWCPVTNFANVPADDDISPAKYRGITVDIPVSQFYSHARNKALYEVLRQAQILTSKVSWKRDGVPYKQHDWNAGSDAANLRRGIDCSRSIWYAFTRAGVPYNNNNSYLHTAIMYGNESRMNENFESCSLNDLQLGDVLVYRGPNKRGTGQAGHTVMVLDPVRELAWGSHGWDGSGKGDTGVEVQRVVPDGWDYWDRRNMQLKACWRHKDFKSTGVSPVQVVSNQTAVGQFPESKSKHLTDADLEDKTQYALWLMRNEMFARYGYPFRNQRLANHFKRKAWYKPVHNRNSQFIYASLFSGVEQHNAEFIYRYEQDMKAGRERRPQPVLPSPIQTQQNSVSGDYPQASIRTLTAADMRGKTSRELRLIRNEIYARHGYCFGVKDLQTHFTKQAWYRCKTRDSAKVYTQRFSQIERDNVNFIKGFE